MSATSIPTANDRADGDNAATSAHAKQASRTDHLTVVRDMLPFVWPSDRPDLRRRVVYAAVLLVIAKLVTVVIPITYKWAVDYLTAAAENPASLATALPVIVTGAILAYAIGRIAMVGFTQMRDVLFTKVGQNAVRALTNRTFRHMHVLSLRFHLEKRTGGLSRVIERALRAIELIIRMGVLNTLPTILELAFISILLAVYFDWRFVVIILVTVGLYLWFTVEASRWRIRIRREMNDSDTEANSKAIDSLLNYETVKYFGNERLEADRFDASMARYEVAAIKTYYSLGWLNFGQALIFTIGLALCMYLAARGVVQGTQTLGDFVMLNAMLIQLYMPLNFLGMVYREIKQALVDLEMMFGLLDEFPEVEDKPGAPALAISNARLVFDNVSFGYEKDRTILDQVSFEVPAGSTVAIVGPSGAGKSTISRLLFRFYDVSDGAIRIDGQDLRDVTQKSLRAAIGVVPQDTVLFNDTIAYNIQYGRPDATEAELRKAAALAQIDGLIEGLPQGYDTMVGERGLKLSGGEKQRVAIARTILKNPPILMLDEATSALDSHTEKEIQDALEMISRDRTTLVIAHRLSTIVNADNIIVLEAGRIAEAGTHAELIALDGLYAGMWNRQRRAEEARQRLAEALERNA